MSKSELRGNYGRDTYYSPQEYTAGKGTPKKITSLDFDPQLDEDFESGPQRAKTQRGKPSYARSGAMVKHSVFNRMMLTQEGKSWDDAYSEMVEKCQGELQKSAMKKHLFGNKTMYDDRYLGLYTDTSGQLCSNCGRGGSSWYVDEQNIIRVVKNKREPYVNEETLAKKLNMLKAPGSVLQYFVKDAGLWYVSDAVYARKEDVHACDAWGRWIVPRTHFKDHTANFFDGKARKWVLLTTKRSANHKEVIQAEALQEKVKETL